MNILSIAVKKKRAGGHMNGEMITELEQSDSNKKEIESEFKRIKRKCIILGTFLEGINR
jgi:hypothetical protein